MAAEVGLIFFGKRFTPEMAGFLWRHVSPLPRPTAIHAPHLRGDSMLELEWVAAKESLYLYDCMGAIGGEEDRMFRICSHLAFIPDREGDAAQRAKNGRDIYFYLRRAEAEWDPDRIFIMATRSPNPKRYRGVERREVRTTWAEDGGAASPVLPEHVSAA